MVYNKKHNRWVSKDGLVFRYDKKKDRLVLCKMCSRKGYSLVRTELKLITVHKLVWETFKSAIPNGMEIDHINTIRDDNRIENLRLVTHKENLNNPLTKSNRKKPHSIFGTKFFEHYGLHKSDNPHLYSIEHSYYKNHNKKCSWE